MDKKQGIFDVDTIRMTRSMQRLNLLVSAPPQVHSPYQDVLPKTVMVSVFTLDVLIRWLLMALLIYVQLV